MAKRKTIGRDPHSWVGNPPASKPKEKPEKKSVKDRKTVQTKPTGVKKKPPKKIKESEPAAARKKGTEGTEGTKPIVMVRWRVPENLAHQIRLLAVKERKTLPEKVAEVLQAGLGKK